MINAGKYSHKIKIYKVIQEKDEDGFPVDTEQLIFSPYASVKTTKGFTLILNNTDFEKAYTNFTIRYSKKVEDAYYESADSNRQLCIKYRNKKYSVEYLKNIDELEVEIEMQCKEILK